MKEKIEELGHGYLLGLLTAKRLGGKQFDPPPLWFFQKVSCRERVKPWFLATFIIISHIFSENFTKVFQVVKKT